MFDNNPIVGNVLYVARFAPAYLVLAFAVIINVMTLPILQAGAVNIASVLMMIFYWSIYRPTLLPAWLVFFVGLFVDIMMLSPLGFNTIIFLLLQKLLINQRRYFTAQPFILLWLGFAVTNMLALGALWCLHALTGPAVIDVKTLLVSAGCSFFMFPLAYLVLHATHKLIPEPEMQRSFKLHRPQKR